MTQEKDGLQERLRACRGVRGATIVADNTPEAILRSARELLALMIRLNGIDKEDVASVIFSTTSDLNAAFPALAARQFGWFDAALMCFHELDVPDSLKMCLRILIHWNTFKRASEIRHVYIKGAEKLRPERGDLPPVDWEDLENWINTQVNPDVVK